jgi:hypothetical protein
MLQCICSWKRAKFVASQAHPAANLSHKILFVAYKDFSLSFLGLISLTILFYIPKCIMPRASTYHHKVLHQQFLLRFISHWIWNKKDLVHFVQKECSCLHALWTLQSVACFAASKFLLSHLRNLQLEQSPDMIVRACTLTLPVLHLILNVNSSGSALWYTTWYTTISVVIPCSCKAIRNDAPWWLYWYIAHWVTQTTENFEVVWKNGWNSITHGLAVGIMLVG